MATVFPSLKEARRAVDRAFPFSVKRLIGDGNRDEIYRWCEENCQSTTGVRFALECEGIEVDQSKMWCHLNGIFWFKNPDHAFAFKMRWF